MNLGHPYCHFELIPSGGQNQLEVSGLLGFLKSLLYWVLLGNVAYREF